jgi:ATP-dependent exoDNAse (exonuclease V) beta subunit
MCYTDEADNFYLFDWKRSKQIKKENNYRKGKDPISHIDDANYWHYALQLNIYKYIIEKNYGINISAIYLVRLHPDQQDYEVMNIPDLSNEVNSMLKTR